MVESDDFRSLARSLFRYGFNSWKAENLELLNKASPKMDADDVRLFGSNQELLEHAKEWGAIIRKHAEREPLTATEKRVKATYGKLGIQDAETLGTFYGSQSLLF